MGGGVLIGFVMSHALAFILKRVNHKGVVCISFMLLTPFLTYLLAETCHVSGVIAVVLLGLGISRFNNTELPENLRQQNKAFWDVIIFLLNGLIFILIGLQLPFVAIGIPKHELWPYIGYSFLITVVALVLRTIRVFWQQRGLDLAFSKKKNGVTEDALLDFKNSLIISWSGMRGIVSLAVAIGLPATLQTGEPFPMRDPIIFMSVAVVLFTLIGQGLTLPWLVKALNVREEMLNAAIANGTMPVPGLKNESDAERERNRRVWGKGRDRRNFRLPE